jgi:hypothetical protein
LRSQSQITRRHVHGSPPIRLGRRRSGLERRREDKPEPRLEKHAAPAIRYHMKDFLAAIDSRAKPVADIEQGYISTASCILANNALKLGRTLAWDSEKRRVVGRRRGEPAFAEGIPQAEDPSRAGARINARMVTDPS